MELNYLRGLYNDSDTVLGKVGNLESDLRKIVGGEYRVFRPRKNPQHYPEIFMRVRVVELNGRMLYEFFDEDCYIEPREHDRLRKLKD